MASIWFSHSPSTTSSFNVSKRCRPVAKALQPSDHTSQSTNHNESILVVDDNDDVDDDREKNWDKWTVPSSPIRRPIVWDVCDHPNHSLSEYPNRFHRYDCEINPTIRENSRATALCLPKPTRLPSEYRNPRIATFWDWRLGDTPRWILSMISSSNFGFEHISC